MVEREIDGSKIIKEEEIVICEECHKGFYKELIGTTGEAICSKPVVI